MSKFISLDAAAQKYKLKKETIFIWQSLYRPYTKKDEEILINEAELVKFLQWRKENKFSEEYLEELETQFHDMVYMNERCCQTIEYQINELKMKDELIAEIDRLKILLGKELERLRNLYEIINRP